MINTDCYGTNYIGIRGECDGKEPESGLYINDYPGVSLKLAVNLADEGSQRGINLIRQYEQQAIKAVWVDLQSELMKCYTLNKIIAQKQYGEHRYDITPAYNPAVAAQGGLIISKADYDPYTALVINYLDIRTNTTIAGKVVKVIDGATTTNYTVDLTAGITTRLNLGYIAQTQQVRITWALTDVSVEDNYINSRCSCSRSCKCGCEGCFEVIGWNGSQKVSNAYGMAVNISCVCNDSAFLCSMKYAIAPLVQMKIAIYLMMDLLTSKRANYMVQNSKEDATNMLLFLNGGINEASGVKFESEYWRTLKVIAGSIYGGLDTGSKCVKCNMTKVVYSIP